MQLAAVVLAAVLGATNFGSSATSGSSYSFKEAGAEKATIEVGGLYCPGASTTAALPASCKNGSIVFDSTANVVKYCVANAWYVAGYGYAAPVGAGYWVKTADTTLTGEQSMGALGTGLVINTTTTGVPTILAAQTCSNTFVRSYTASGTATCASVNLSTDTAATALPAAKGGTGRTTLSAHGVLQGDTAGTAYYSNAVPDCTGAGGKALNYSTSTQTWSCAANESWTTVSSFSNSWLNYGSGYAPVSYRKGADGRVYLRGLVKSGTIGLAAFTLPSGYRPTYPQSFVVETNGAAGFVFIATDGTVVPSAGNNGYVYLNPVAFFLDQ